MIRILLTSAAIAVLIATCSLKAQTTEGMTYKIYGSIGSEADLTPQNNGSPINPGGFLGLPLWGNTSNINLFGDFAPDDKRWKVHIKLRGENDWNGDNVSHAEVAELYFNWSVTPWLDLSVGRKIDKWGTGYGWNPTGILNPPKDPRDPNDRREAFRGTDQASIDLFIKGWDLTGVIAPVIPWTGNTVNRAVPVGWAARIYRLVDSIDLSITASGGSGLPDSQGVSVSRVFGKSLELHAEAAAFHNTLRFTPEINGYETSRRTHSETLLGGQYTFANYLNLTVEYYHNGANLSAEEWNLYRVDVDQGRTALASGNPSPLAQLAQEFSVLSMGRDYAFVRAAYPLRQQKLDAELISISSLRDGSTIIQPALYWKLTQNFLLYCVDTEFAGRPRSEVGFVPLKRQTEFGFRFHF